jgi:hypothetical protein
MSASRYIQQLLMAPVLRRNRKFSGIHKGETCYIIGNGASLKSMDLSCFDDKLTIGMNFLCVHNQFAQLNAPYYVITAPKFLYPVYENPYTGKLQLSPTIQAFKKAIRKFPEINLFTSISNIFGYAAPRHNYYLHHFGRREPDASLCDMSGIFSFMKGGLYAGIGTAIYMGFQKVMLVGCDYLFTPVQENHFYGAGRAETLGKTQNIYASLLNEASQFMDISLVTDTNISQWLPYEKYEDLTGRKLAYRENTDLVDREYLDYFDQAYKKGMYLTPIYDEGVAV